MIWHLTIAKSPPPLTHSEKYYSEVPNSRGRNKRGWNLKIYLLSGGGRGGGGGLNILTFNAERVAATPTQGLEHLLKTLNKISSFNPFVPSADLYPMHLSLPPENIRKP